MEDLSSRLRDARAVMLTELEGLSEYDRRRSVTPTGTNLLGRVGALRKLGQFCSLKCGPRFVWLLVCLLGADAG